VQKRKRAIERKRERRRKRKRGKRIGFTPWSRSSTSKASSPGRLSTHFPKFINIGGIQPTF
jgi:hypothetical protein